MELLGVVHNSYIHVSVRDIYIPKIGLPIWLQQNRQTDPGNILLAQKYMNVEMRKTEHDNSVLEIMRPRSFVSGNT
jgi:hypothetical protein